MPSSQLGLVLQNALGINVEHTENLTEEEYRRQLNDLLKCILVDLKEEVADLVKARTDEAFSKGLSASTVDAKSIELEVLKIKEDAIAKAGLLIAKRMSVEDMKALFGALKGLLSIFPKARMAKITRSLIDTISTIPNSENLQITTCLECIEWCDEERRTFLKHRIQTKLIGLYEQMGKYQAGMEKIPELLREVKRLDDKQLLVEIHLVEAKLYFSVGHIARAKAAVTAAKTNANAIHCPPLLQAEMDLVAGALHAEEDDFRTAYSYFYESFEAFTNHDEDKALQSLKYMLLCRIMTTEATGDITNIGRGSAGLKYFEKPDIQILIDIAKAHQDRSLERFEQILAKNRKLIESDKILARHIEAAAEQLLEQAILKALEPYSEVEIDFIAKKTKLSIPVIEQKLSAMILDGRTSGTLDQRRGVFILFDRSKVNPLYSDSIETFQTLEGIVSLLANKVHAIA